MKKSEIIVNALEYIREFRGKVFVVKLGGEVMLDERIIASVAQDLIFLHIVGIKPVVVHGGGGEISHTMDKLGKAPVFVEGLRKTDKETMDIVEMVLTGKVNTQIVSQINKHNGHAVGLSGKSGRLFEARKTNQKVDIGFVGEITKVNPHILETQLQNGYIPVVSPVGLAKSGESLNINADTAASKLAQAMNASKLIILTNVRGVLDKDSRLIKRLTLAEAVKTAKSKTVKGGMKPKIKACIEAINGGVNRTHIVKANTHAVLEEILTKKGTGTLITKNKIKD
ncbi:MAG: acetylglutamate kinase [Candidatus Altiarchaeales archaeon]|nr:acetylglutamate kinase [Candidatus Altiarchaeales archaeon]